MINLDKSFIEKLYFNELKTTVDIAISISTINRFFKSNNIKLRERGNIKEKKYSFEAHNKYKFSDEQIDKIKQLFYEYVTVPNISNELNVSKKSVNRVIKELGLKRNNSLMMSRKQYDNSNDNEIIRLYQEGKSTTEIGNILKMTHKTVESHLKFNNIKIRTISESQFVKNNKEYPKELNDKDWLYTMYVDNKLSKSDISKLLNISPSVVDKSLKKYNISVRGVSECKFGLMSGNKHPNWKGGRCSLYNRLREFFKTNLVGKCQICGSNKNLHVHHIKSLKSIFEEILSEHRDLDIKKDKEKLYEIITNDDRFLNKNNLITYCKDCHFYKVHKYNKNNG